MTDSMEAEKNLMQTIDSVFPAIPQNIFEKREELLKTYVGKKSSIQEFINENLVQDVDYGKTDNKAKSLTLMKSGSEKINEYMMCRVKLYPDKDVYKMWGSRPGSVCFVTYIIDQEIMRMILQYLLQVGMEWEEPVVKLLAWGEGRGACEENEKVYGSNYGTDSGMPLKGAMNRVIKMAEKRAIVDATIRTFNLEFSQDPEYGQKGKLKGDRPAERKKSKPAEPQLPAENMSVYQACLVLLQEQYKGYRVFNHQEMIGKKKNVDAVKKDLDKLVNLHEVLKKVSEDVKQKIDLEESGEKGKGDTNAT